MDKKAFNRKVNEARKRLSELTQSEFNALYANKEASYKSTAISQKEKNNLYADIKDFEQEFRDLQQTARELPDDYIENICDTNSYPFDAVIDDVDDVEDWCHEAEEFLKSDINSWGTIDTVQKYY